ncbi:S9 family peptidase [Balneola vulgaris]|uniref:S9 family peptidase n=1 Tax=Balneola vulgaris TaxID=287535 RepID=UPI0003A4171D|nr:alpha/beta fold hydrolase [Balneola vulgaris]
MKYLSLLFLLPLLFVSSNDAQAQTPLDTLSLKRLMHEPYIPGNRPSFIRFSVDGKYAFYSWRKVDEKRSKTYKVKLNGKDVEEASSDFVRSFTLSPNGDQLIYQKRGDIVIADKNFENERTLIASKGFDYSATWNTEGTKIAYAVNGDVWITGVTESMIKQVTAKKDEEPSYSIVGWGGDDKIVVRQSDNSDSKEYYFPEYAGKYVKTGASRRGVSTNSVSVVDIASGKVKELFEAKGYVRSDVSHSGKYAMTDAMDPAMKKRTITIYDLEQDSSYVVFEDSTQGWLYGTNSSFAPTEDKIMLQNEKDGWNHIYTIHADGSNFKQHTTGAYDIPFVRWIDDNQMVIATNEVDYGETHIYTLDLKSNNKKQITKAEAHRRDFRLSSDKRYVAYSRTYFNEPADLYVVDLKKAGKETRITDTVPEGFADMGWQKEEYIRFTGRDGETEISASILKPDQIDRANGNPVVVFVHGAGSLQNVFKGWSFSYWREYMFHQLLTKKGYYVIEVDYRHSTGYGRKFREDVTNWMGKYETEDIQDGLALLAERHPAADTSRVGIYGGSYGGFMALYAVSQAPESFDAAAALRAVTNWENYYYTNPWYTLPRLGTPEADSANYARSSPLTFAEDLDKPVIILHGLIDNNVGFQDAVQYIEKLVQSGNENFDMMMYPTERHSFRDPDAWYDEYRRIYEFFEKHLR